MIGGKIFGWLRKIQSRVIAAAEFPARGNKEKWREKRMNWELIWQITPFTIIGAVILATVARWICDKLQQPHLDQKITSKQERRIKSLPVIKVELEIRQLLKEAVDQGINISDLSVLETLLVLVYRHPERYERLPNIKDASIKGKPIPQCGS